MDPSKTEYPICTMTFPLLDGQRIPVIGLGSLEKYNISTFSDDEKIRIRDSITEAIKLGYRLIDTATIYGTEEMVGAAIRASGVPRSEIVVIGKLPNYGHHDPKSFFRESLRKLDIGYIDIYLMHWPNALLPDGSRALGPEESPTMIETYKMMEALVGPECRSIGVSNFTQKTLDELLKHVSIMPVMNEIECHPLNSCLNLVQYCQEKGIQVAAWGPLAGGPTSHYTPKIGTKVYESPILKPLASKYGVPIGVIILSWLVQRRVIPVPHSASTAHLAENLRLVVPLTDAEVSQINGMEASVGHMRLIEYATFAWEDMPGTAGKKKFFGWTTQEMGWEDWDGKNLL